MGLGKGTVRSMINLNSLYMRAIKKRVCAVCEEQTTEGTCGLPLGAVCPIELYLPKIVDVVHGVSSINMKDYVEALRNSVCASCPNQNPDGACLFRSKADCGLNRYFSLVVDAIEEVDEEMAWPQVC